MTEQDAARSAPRPSRDDWLPDQTSDDLDIGWGDERTDDEDDLRRFLDDVPPHHGS